MSHHASSSTPLPPPAPPRLAPSSPGGRLECLCKMMGERLRRGHLVIFAVRSERRLFFSFLIRRRIDPVCRADGCLLVGLSTVRKYSLDSVAIRKEGTPPDTEEILLLRCGGKTKWERI